MSMLELAKLDPDVEGARVKTRRAFSREGSLTRVGSTEAPFLDILSRIRVPSQRAAMAEMAAAAWCAKKFDGEARLVPYTVLSCVPGALAALASTRRCAAKGGKRAPVDSQPKMCRCWSLLLG